MSWCPQRPEEGMGFWGSRVTVQLSDEGAETELGSSGRTIGAWDAQTWDAEPWDSEPWDAGCWALGCWQFDRCLYITVSASHLFLSTTLKEIYYCNVTVKNTGKQLT